jgi:CheY-like chemotaxis protein
MAEPERAYERRVRAAMMLLLEPPREQRAARTVLIIETNSFVVDVVESALKPLRASLVHAADADSAIALARVVRPALIMMEVALPSVSAYELLARLRRDPDVSDVPVIALTARPLSEERLYLEHAGFAACLGKPLDLPSLLAAVQRHL